MTKVMIIVTALIAFSLSANAQEGELEAALFDYSSVTAHCRWPPSRRDGLQRMSSDWSCCIVPKSEIRRAEFRGRQSHALDERTLDQSFSPFFAPHNAKHHSGPGRDRFRRSIYREPRKEIGSR